MSDFEIPPFKPPRWLRGSHAQTLWAHFRKAHAADFHIRLVQKTKQHLVHLADGDAFVLHENSAAHDQKPTTAAVTAQPVPPTCPLSPVLLLPGLTGCHESGYMQRTAAKLVRLGYSVFRMDPRGWGASVKTAHHSYHAGRVEDVAAAVEYVAHQSSTGRVALVGFSLSGNLVLKYLADYGETPLPVCRAAAVCPAIDLARCAARLQRGWSERIYGRHYLKFLCAYLQKHNRWPVEESVAHWRKRTLYEFDDVFTAPHAGFQSADEYYERSSAKPHLAKIATPTFIIAADDDPVVPGDCFDGLKLPSTVLLHRSRFGGHLGFVSGRSTDADARWLEWRIVDWLQHTAS